MCLKVDGLEKSCRTTVVDSAPMMNINSKLSKSMNLFGFARIIAFDSVSLLMD